MCLELAKAISDYASNNPLRCLIVENDKELRYIIETVLRDLGFEVFGTDNGKHAVILQAQTPFDVMILHWNNQKLHGEKVLTAMSLVCDKVPHIIIMTGGDIISFHLDLPVDAFLFKPFSGDDVINSIWKAINHE